MRKSKRVFAGLLSFAIGATSFNIAPWTMESVQAAGGQPQYESVKVKTSSLNGNAIWGATEDWSIIKGGITGSQKDQSKGADGWGAYYVEGREEGVELGLPQDGKLVVAQVPYEFMWTGKEAYDGNDSMRMTPSQKSKSVELATYGSYDKLYVLGMTGGYSVNQTSKLDVTLTYTDGTQEKSTLTLGDWAKDWNADGKSELKTSKDLGCRQMGGTNAYFVNYFMQSFGVKVDSTKLLKNVEFSFQATHPDMCVSIFSFTGVTHENAPQAPVISTSRVTMTGWNTSWAKDKDAKEYYIDVATDKNFDNILPTYNNKKLTHSDLVEGEDGYTYVINDEKTISKGETYYVRVRSGNDSGHSLSSNVCEVAVATHEHELKYEGDNTKDAKVVRVYCEDPECTEKYNQSNPLTLTLEAKDIDYYSEGKAVTITDTITGNVDASVEITYYKVDTKGAVTGGEKLASMPKAVGNYYAQVTVTDHSNPEKTATVVAPYEITKYNPIVGNFKYQAPANLVYDGKAKEATVTATVGKEEIGDITVSYYDKNNNKVDKPINVGTYVVKASAAGGNNVDPIPEVAVGEFTITPISYTGNKSVAQNIPKDEGCSVLVTLPELPEGARYGTPNNSNTDIAVGTVAQEGTIMVTSKGMEEGKKTTFTVPVTGALNYDSYDVTVNLTAVSHNHVGNKVTGKQPTYTEDGWKDYYTCECGKNFEDQECTKPIVDLESWKVGDGKLDKLKKETGRAPIEDLIAIAPTRENGEDGKIIGLDKNKKYEYKPVEAGEDGYTKLAIGTVEIRGLTAGKYDVRYQETEEFTAGEAKEVEVPPYQPEQECTHDVVVKMDGKLPSYEEDGWKDYYQCQDCGKIFEDSDHTKEIPDLEDWKKGAGKLDKITEPSEGLPIVEALTGVAPTGPREEDGKIIGLDSAKDYEYKLSTDTEYIKVPKNSLEILNLKPGTYDVRYPETATTKAGEAKQVVVPGYTAPAHTHSATRIDGKKPTTSEDGWKDYYQCNCGEFFEDEECKKPITDLESWKVGAGKLDRIVVTTTEEPTVSPSVAPSTKPSVAPSVAPSTKPSVAPSTKPSVAPSVAPSTKPSVAPSVAPSTKPSVAPSKRPTATPTPNASTPSKQQIYKNETVLNAGLKVAQKGDRIEISWGKVKSATGYRVYVQYCGMPMAKKPTMKVKSYDVTKVVVKKINGKKLNLKQNFKVCVEAYKIVDGKTVILGQTITAHIVGRKNYKSTNVKKVTATKSQYSLKKGKTAQIKAATVLVDKKKKPLDNRHAAELRYRSSNKTIATVSSKGKIKAKSKGSCYVYVYARNGYAKKIKVTVK